MVPTPGTVSRGLQDAVGKVWSSYDRSFCRRGNPSGGSARVPPVLVRLTVSPEWTVPRYVCMCDAEYGFLW